MYHCSNGMSKTMLVAACNAPYENTIVLYPFKCDKVESAHTPLFLRGKLNSDQSSRRKRALKTLQYFNIIHPLKGARVRRFLPAHQTSYFID